MQMSTPPPPPPRDVRYANEPYLVEHWFVVVDVAQFDVDPTVGHVILVVVVVLALVVDLDHEAESVALQFVLVIQRLDNFERSGAVVVAHHRELVRSESAAVDHLKFFKQTKKNSVVDLFRR